MKPYILIWATEWNSWNGAGSARAPADARARPPHRRPHSAGSNGRISREELHSFKALSIKYSACQSSGRARSLRRRSRSDISALRLKTLTRPMTEDGCGGSRLACGSSWIHAALCVYGRQFSLKKNEQET
ncbi:hypothetical protein EVAR_72609_1 [Eumeta japonica]|uniref:Uncharacterized protein n=1 Tax=Eumeta variegata TaxID=151549 RepID=A0A4C1TCS9_EUMVA|nr:hypothetical protein EVAR_72609_1 [Eumeta japonica]